jgi:hypothetical protein
MKNILIICICLLCVFTPPPVKAQFLTPTMFTLSGTDTLSGGAAKNFNLTINGSYYWSASVYYDKLTGSTDTNSYTLQESVDGVHYTNVVGSPVVKFTADGTYTWTGGTGGLPLVWASGYFRLAGAYLHACTCTSRPYVYLYLKPTNPPPY